MRMGMNVTMGIMPITIMPASAIRMVVMLARASIVRMGLRGALA
ncbi:hypothetical protein ACERNI_17435 [Camelimonas sp. ID_303_24]